MPDDGLIRDIPLIRRYSRHNEAQDWKFRAYIKASPLSNAKLDEIAQQTTDEVWAKIDCLACGNCCKTLAIVVDTADIKRLSGRLRTTPQKFTAKYTVPDPESGGRLLQSRPCVFLGADNKCAVYEDRPQACRDFPYLHSPNFRSRSISMVENAAMCPIVFNVWQALKERFWRKRK